MSNKRESSDKHRHSRLEQLDRLVPLVGLGVLAYVAARVVADRRDARRQLTGLAGAIAEIRNRNAGAPDSPPARRSIRERFSRTKQFLVLAMLVALISVLAGGGTFASFSAETGNPGSSVASGTLTLSDTPNTSTNTLCASQNAPSLDNYNETCDAILALTNQAPGVTDTTGTYPGGWGKVTIQNTGTLNASLFSLWAPYVNARLTSSISSGATIGTGQSVTSFTVSAIEGPVATNDQIYLAAGLQSQEFCAGAPAAAGATSITISGGYAIGSSGSCPAPGTTTAGTSYGTGTRVQDQSSDTMGAPSTTLNGAITNSATSITVANGSTFPAAPFTAQIDSEQVRVTATSGVNNVNWTVTRAYNGTTAVSHNSGVTVQGVPNTDCFDQLTTAASSATPAFNFNSPTFTPLCRTALLWIQEKTTYGSSTYHYCWFGRGSQYGDQGGGEDSNGQCRTPTTMVLASNVNSTGVTTQSTTTTLNGAISNSTTSITVASGTGFSNGQTVVVDNEQMTIVSGGGTTSWTVTRNVNGTSAAAHSNGATVTPETFNLNVGTLNGNIRYNDTITFSESGNTMTCNAAATYNVALNTASIPIAVFNCSGGNSQTFDSSASVKDTTAFTALNGTNPSSTISNFDTSHGPGSPITMAPLTANGTVASNPTIELGKSGSTGATPDTRVFYVGIYIPNGGSNQNNIQGLFSTFGLTFHIDQ